MIRLAPLIIAALALANCAYAPPTQDELALPGISNSECQIVGHLVRDAFGQKTSGGPISIAARPAAVLFVYAPAIPGLSEAEAEELEGMGAGPYWSRLNCDWMNLDLPDVKLTSSAAPRALKIILPIYTRNGAWAAAQSYRGNRSRTCVFRNESGSWIVVRCSADIIVVAG